MDDSYNKISQDLYKGISQSIVEEENLLKKLEELQKNIPDNLKKLYENKIKKERQIILNRQKCLKSILENRLFSIL